VQSFETCSPPWRPTFVVTVIDMEVHGELQVAVVAAFLVGTSLPHPQHTEQLLVPPHRRVAETCMSGEVEAPRGRHL